jgi:hypothetical protein
MPGAQCTRKPRVQLEKPRGSRHRSTGTPDIPARNGFDGFLRALPVTGTVAAVIPEKLGISVT